MLETDVQSKIIKFLKPRAYVVKIVSASTIGIPDLLVCYRGLFLALEVKRPKNPSKTHEELQAYNRRVIIENGGYGFKVTSVNEVKKILEQIDDTLSSSGRSS